MFEMDFIGCSKMASYLAKNQENGWIWISTSNDLDFVNKFQLQLIDSE